MANGQLIADRSPSAAGPKPFYRINVIDNGDGTCTIYFEDRANSDGVSTAAAVPATGLKVVGLPASGVTGSGSAGFLPIWDSPSDLSNSSAFEDAANFQIDIPGKTFVVGDIGNLVHRTKISVVDSGSVIVLNSVGTVNMGDTESSGNDTTILIDDTAQTISFRANDGATLNSRMAIGLTSISLPAPRLQVVRAGDSDPATVFSGTVISMQSDTDGVLNITTNHAHQGGIVAMDENYPSTGFFGGILYTNKAFGPPFDDGWVILCKGGVVANFTPTTLIFTPNPYVLSGTLQFDNSIQIGGPLRFGGQTNAFPMIARLGGLELHAKLADDSAYTAFHASAYFIGATAGVDGTFITADAKTVTVTKGIITAIV